MDQPLTNFAEICSHFVPCIYILVYRNNLQLQGNTLIQTLMVESSPRGMDQADIRSIPTSNQMVLVFVSRLSSKIIISSIQFGSASAFYCSGSMPPGRPSISLNTGPAKVIVIGLMFDRAEKGY